jgi:hypothetical protein
MVDLKDTDIQVFAYRPQEPIKVQLKRQLERIDVHSELAHNLMPVEVRPGLMVGTITGSLEAKDNRFELQPLTRTHVQSLQSSPTRGVPPTQYTYGNLDVTALLQRLIKSGILDAKLEQTSTGALIKMVINCLMSRSIQMFC